MPQLDLARLEHRQAQNRWRDHYYGTCRRCREGLRCISEIGLDKDASASGVRLTLIEVESRRAVGAGR